MFGPVFAVVSGMAAHAFLVFDARVAFEAGRYWAVRRHLEFLCCGGFFRV